MKTILYVGNNLTIKTNYSTSMDVLSDMLIEEGYEVIKSSSKINKLLRLIDMCYSIYKNRNKINYVLIDTFSTTNFYYAVTTSMLCRCLKLKYLPILRGGNLPYRLKKSPKLSNLIFNNSFKNISPSGYLKSEFKKYGIESILIPNIIELKNYTFNKRQNIKPNLIYVRAFAEIYNPTMAIEVLKELKKTYPKATLCMVGPDKDGTLKKVEELINKYQLSDSVQITGVLLKKEWIKKSEKYDIFINTTNVDNTPISVIEAMALGITVISTNAGGLPYLIDHLINGVLVAKNDVKNMTLEINKIIHNNNNTLAISARKKIEQYDVNVVKHLWNQILK